MTPEAQAFILEYGHLARSHHLAHLLQQPAAAIERVRGTGAMRRLPKHLDFGELFTRWRGRPPRDDEWPAPRRVGRRRSYEWQAPDYALIASLVGTVGPVEIRQALNARLRRVTGDPNAERSKNAVQTMINKIGLQTSDVVGGVTIAQAAKEIGTRSILDHEIRVGKLHVVRVGRYLVIPHDELARWKGTRVFPPAGFIKLAKLRKRLGIRSDKLSEWARLGYIPTAIRCNPSGTGEKNTQFGTWYIDPKVARKILVDRRAGRPMPWWGKPEPHNLRITFTLWQKRKHPARCSTCAVIWGPAGPPRTFEGYCARYHPLAHGAKRHLTMVYSDGLTRSQVAELAMVSLTTVQRAIANGAIRASRVGQQTFVTRTDATRWKARRCPTGESMKSWLAIRTACNQYGFTPVELERFIASGALLLKIGTDGPQRGYRFVLRQQVRELRDMIGYSESEAARQAKVSISRLRVLLRGLEWRPTERIPFAVIHNVIKRKYSRCGWTIADAARLLGKPTAWIRAEILAGTIRPLRTTWDKRRLYISAPMMKRLRAAAARPRPTRVRFTKEWLLQGQATHLAGVSTTTLQRWGELGEVKCQPSEHGRRYHRRSVISRARTYWAWASKRYKRAAAPAWLQEPAA